MSRIPSHHLGVIAMLLAGCGAGASTSVSGRIDSAAVNFTNAFYGVFVVAISSAPPSTILSIGISDHGCDSRPTVDLLFVSPMTGTQEMIDGLGAGYGTDAEFSAVGSVTIDSIDVAHLPIQPVHEPPYPEATGTIEGFVSLTVGPPEGHGPNCACNETGSLSGHFVADHCVALDTLAED